MVYCVEFLENRVDPENSEQMALVGAALIFFNIAQTAPPAELPGVSAKENAADFSAPPFDREVASHKRVEVHDWLLSQAVKEGLSEPLQAFVSDTEKAEIDNARGEIPPRVGLSKSVSANVNFRGLYMSALKGRTLTLANGAIGGSADGGFVYTVSLTSPGATAMRLHFTGFQMPPRTGLYLYTDTGEVFGPYTGRGPLGTGQFWSHTVEGDYVILQLHHMGQASDDVLHGSGFTISRVGHLRPRLMAGFCGFNAPCVENASCGTHAAVTDAKDAVAEMLFVSGAFLYICSGGLLNDTDPDTTIPHFLTARHCISKGGEAASLETFFKFTTSCGTSNCPSLSSVLQSQRTMGSTISVSKRASDYPAAAIRTSTRGQRLSGLERITGGLQRTAPCSVSATHTAHRRPTQSMRWTPPLPPAEAGRAVTGFTAAIPMVPLKAAAAAHRWSTAKGRSSGNSQAVADTT